ncbi:MAG: FIST C-terminal domain-containing protein [Rhodobacteraceae bacterium]|nr:FIST C-terminal domain-containing protein [Paracoccaceae bacterium]
MEGGFLSASDSGASTWLVRRAQVRADVPDPVLELKLMLGDGPFSLIAVFSSPQADFPALVKQMSAAFPNSTTIGCTTAGELGMDGYTESEIVAIALPEDRFQVSTLIIDDLSHMDRQELVGQMVRTRSLLAEKAPALTNEFAFLLIDGLSIREDELVSAAVNGLGSMPLFGGSAGDGTRFQQTLISHDGQVFEDAALITFVRTDCHVHVFSLDHFKPTEQRMVVTSADPARRIVHEINAEPASREYARLLGKDPEQLTSFTFAAHPVVVRIGGQHHVRSIQRVMENGDLVFFSAIDEGLVLTLAEPEDMETHLKRELQRISGGRTPDAILACDCILRRLEAQEKQQTRSISGVMSDHRVIGFSTYGEQINGMHVNQTMTGVAIFPPDAG